MKSVNIITQSSINSIKPRDGAIGYLLEMETQKGPATLSKIRCLQNATANSSELQVLIDALKRLREPCELSIYTESKYVAAGFANGWVKEWVRNGWITTRGTEVANRKEWEELNNLLKIHTYRFLVQEENSYRSWIKEEVCRKEKEKQNV